jgi:hypothetical protein
MADRAALTQEEIDSRQRVVALAVAMLRGEISYFEGAAQLCALRHAVGGITDDDADFGAFLLMSSETDHLPLKKSWHLWSTSALVALSPECQCTEEWALGIAPGACENLVKRFRSPNT